MELLRDLYFVHSSYILPHHQPSSTHKIIIIVIKYSYDTYTSLHACISERKLWEVMDMFINLIVVMVSYMYAYHQAQQAIYIRYIYLFTYQSYLSRVV